MRWTSLICIIPNLKTTKHKTIEYWLFDFEDNQFQKVLLVICLLNLFEMTKKKTWKFSFYSFYFYIILNKNDQSWIREKWRKEYKAIQLIAHFYSCQTGTVFQNRITKCILNVSSRVYLTKNSNECNKFFLDGDNEGVDIVTIDDISLHIKGVSHCSDDTPVIELSDFTFQGLPCNLPNDITIYTGLGSERFQADTWRFWAEVREFFLKNPDESSSNTKENKLENFNNQFYISVGSIVHAHQPRNTISWRFNSCCT